MANQTEATEWEVETLHDHLETGEEFFVFDVRNEDEFESWQIEGRRPLPTVNVPYYEMLEVDEFDDVVDSFKAFLSQSWAEKLPRDKEILAVCAKGDTSEFVAQALRGLEFEAFNLAVSDSGGAAGFRRQAGGPSPGLRLQGGEEGQGAESVTVEAVALDEFLVERGIVPDVVKIDVEGAEMKVLTGMRRTLDSHPPVLFLEVHPSGLRSLGSSASALLSLLFENGYSASEIEDMRSAVDARRLRPLDADSILERNSMLYCVPHAPRG